MNKPQKIQKHLSIRSDEDFYYQIRDTAHELRTTGAGLFRIAMQKYLEALEKAKTLTA